MSFKISPKDICQKQTQYCKAIILQLKINKPKKKKKKPSTRKKVSPKKFKNLGINLSKEVKNLHAGLDSGGRGGGRGKVTGLGNPCRELREVSAGLDSGGRGGGRGKVTGLGNPSRELRPEEKWKGSISCGRNFFCTRRSKADAEMRGAPRGR